MPSWNRTAKPTWTVCTARSVCWWFSPNWISVDGIGNWGTLLEAGTWYTNLSTATGAWGLYISPDASTLYFSAQTNGFSTNLLNAPIAWNAGEWHSAALTYTATNSALYLDGALAATGTGVTVNPGTNATTFSIGSDGNTGGTGLLQARGVFADVATYDYPVTAEAISNNYAVDSELVYPLPSSGRFSADYSAPSLPGGFGGGGTNTPEGGGSGYVPQIYTNGFYLQILSPGTNAYNADTNSATVILNGTIADIDYQLLSATNLNNPVWVVEQNLIGSETTNFTVTMVSMAGRPTLFFKAMAYTLDSDGDGLPDWWETKYSTSGYPLSPTNADTGNTGIPDGYKQDSAGDGYNNLQKYQMGVAPTCFCDTSGPGRFDHGFEYQCGNIVVNWPAGANLPSSGAGAVTGYTLLLNSNADMTGADQTFTTNQLSYDTDTGLYSDVSFYLEFPGYFSPPTYSFQINYANTNSAWVSNQIPFSADDTVAGSVVRGPGGGVYLAVSAVPQNVTVVRVLLNVNQDPSGAGSIIYPVSLNDTLYNNAEEYFPPATGTSFDGMGEYFDVPVTNITNGLYQIPKSQVPLYSGNSIVILGVGQDGNLGDVFPGTPTNDWGDRLFGGAPGAINIPFIDGRTNIAQNINFLLRAANTVAPLLLNVGQTWYSGADAGTNYVYAGFSFEDNYYGYVDNYLFTAARRNEFQPFEDRLPLTYYSQAAFGLEGFNEDGTLTNGVIADDSYFQVDLPLYPTLPTYNYVLNNASNYPAPPIAPLLNGDSAKWILTFPDPPCPTPDAILLVISDAGTFVLIQTIARIYTVFSSSPSGNL